uniref:receptor protein serine/threonine kinase n=2 Tax=Caenorhabditis japonica TaxID=281687 RepID=A0A8R1I1N2_CAEJA
MTACIADFGLARIYNFDISRSDILGQVGTRRYMSPEMLEGATEFTPTAFKAMDVYSMALVMWEVISRTRVSFDDKVPEYEAPYNHLGFNPPVGSMRSHVVQKKERPAWRQEHLEHEHVKELIKIVEWMWEPEAYARITAGCAFSKTWTAVQNAAECSEGYHSGGSTKDMEKVLLAGVENEKKEAKILKPEDIGEMVRYHEFPYDKPHPSANPFKDVCPSPPTIPDLSDLLALGVLQSEPQEEQGRADDLAPSEEEQVFDMTANRLLTDDEKVRVDPSEVVPSVTRASTPTPSGSI